MSREKTRRKPPPNTLSKPSKKSSCTGAAWEPRPLEVKNRPPIQPESPSRDGAEIARGEAKRIRGNAIVEPPKPSKRTTENRLTRGEPPSPAVTKRFIKVNNFSQNCLLMCTTFPRGAERLAASDLAFARV